MFGILKTIIVLLFLFPFAAYSQPELEIYPDEIEFENIFSRLENIYFINKGNTSLRIDSIAYNSNIYYVRFDHPYAYPFYIDPGDSVIMDCILAGYYYVPSSDTSDTMFVYSNSINNVENIEVKIDYYDDDYDEGVIGGYISDSVSVVAGAEVYFFYEGNYIINSAITDLNGYYSANLPPGSYTIAAEKDSYYVTFYGQQFDPLDAEFISIEDDSVKSADILLVRQENTFNSASGTVSDSLSNAPLRKGLVVVRNGTHTPTKIAGTTNRAANGVYTAFIKDSGSYTISNIVEPGYYYIQSFSDYFLPSYYSSSNTAQVFWQNADSVLIDSNLDNLDILMPRDSSLGGGVAKGSVNLTSRSGELITGVVIYAQSQDNSYLFNYAFSAEDGNFTVPFLPYGNYRLIAQKIGYNDGYSSLFTIDSANTVVGNLGITLNPTSVNENPALPENYTVLYNYPNPFNPSTTIGFNLSSASEVELKIINPLGEEVKVLLKKYFNAGNYEISFNAEDLNSGVYLAVLKIKEDIFVKKILLLK